MCVCVCVCVCTVSGDAHHSLRSCLTLDDLFSSELQDHDLEAQWVSGEKDHTHNLRLNLGSCSAAAVSVGQDKTCQTDTHGSKHICRIYQTILTLESEQRCDAAV